MKLTDAQRRGLLAFDNDGHARRSNYTNAERHVVYWQTLTTLRRLGLCELGVGYDTYQLTDTGLAARAELAAT